MNVDPWLTVVAFPLIGVAESLLAFHSLRHIFGKRVALTNATKVSKFAAVCFLAPIVPAVVGALIVAYAFGSDFQFAFMTWYLADSLGLLVITPAILLIRQNASASDPEVTTDALVRHFFFCRASR